MRAYPAHTRNFEPAAIHQTHQRRSHIQAVMQTSLVRPTARNAGPGMNVRQTAQRLRSFGARTLSLTSGAAGGAGLRRAAGPTRSRAPANRCLISTGSDGGALTTLGRWRGGCGVVTCGRRPIGETANKKPAADFSAAGSTISE